MDPFKGTPHSYPFRGGLLQAGLTVYPVPLAKQGASGDVMAGLLSDN